MATQVIPTMRVKMDPNPRGSATATATMPAANPFERETLSVRPANQPLSMMPGMGQAGMGDLGFSFTSFFEDTLIPTTVGIGTAWLGQQIGLQPGQALPVTNQPQQMQTPQTSPVPTSPPAQQIPTYTVSPPAPAPAPTGAPSKLPWIIGGAAVLAVGGILLMRGKKRR